MCAFASVLVVVVTATLPPYLDAFEEGKYPDLDAFEATLPDSDALEHLGKYTGSDALEEGEYTGTKFGEELHAGIPLFPEFRRSSRLHYRTFEPRYEPIYGPSYEQPHGRQLSSCPLALCQRVAFKYCVFKGCEDLTQLQLLQKGITGPLPQGLKSMNKLTYLDIRGNGLTGNIEVLGELTELRMLAISHNAFTGGVEALGNLTKLEALIIDANEFTGNVSALGDLTELKQLGMSNNQLTGSTKALGTLTKLEQLYIQHNNFTGDVTALGSLTQLLTLDAGYNQLTGSVAPFGKLTQLKVDLSINDNQFTGGVEALGTLIHLGGLYVDNNDLSGSVDALGTLANLTSLNLQRNKLTGTVDGLAKLTQLTQLYAEHNAFVGSIEPVGKLTKLTSLWLGHNQFNGTLNALGELKELRQLLIRNNLFTGGVEALGALVHLEMLSIQLNKLTGSVEPLGKNCKQLQKLDVSLNQFTGIVTRLGDLKELEYLNVNLNRFTGEMQALGKLSKLTTLDAHNNLFTGGVSDLHKLANLRRMYIYSNQLTGKLDGIGKLSRLGAMYASHNKFTGSVKPLGDLKHLQFLEVDNNALSGSVDALGSLDHLKSLNLQRNKLTGTVDGLGNLTKLTELYVDHNEFVGSIEPFGKLTKLTRLYVGHNQFTGTLSVLGNLTKLEALMISSSGDLTPPVPTRVFALAPSDVHGLGLGCKWLDDDGLPSITGPYEHYAPIGGADIFLKCRNSRFPVLSDGSLRPVIESSSSSCAEAGLSVIATKAECERAVNILGGDGKRIASANILPYCGLLATYGVYTFHSLSAGERMASRGCAREGMACVCKEGLKSLKVNCVYQGGKAQWSPNIDSFKCLGYGACPTHDSSATALKETSGVDVSACTNLQDGGYCDDYACSGFKIRNPERNKIRCKFSVWHEPRKQYCVFCPPGRHKATSTTCADCSPGKFLVSGPDNDKGECTQCAPGWFQPDAAQSECRECAAGQHSAKGQLKCEACATGRYQDLTGQAHCRKCQFGKYQPKERQTECQPCEPGNSCQNASVQEPCPKGKYQEKASQEECNACSPGQFQDAVEKTECKECPRTTYQDEEGGSACKPCLWCPQKGTAILPLNPFWLVGPVVAGLLIVACCYLIQWIEKIRTRKKNAQPQSSEDAARAKKFTTPRESREMRKYIRMFNKLQKDFLTDGWTDEEVAEIRSMAMNVLRYLAQRVVDAGTPEESEIMTCCLQTDAYRNFRTMYQTTWENIRESEAEGLKACNAAVKKMRKTVNKNFEHNSSSMTELFRSGRIVYYAFHEFLGEVAQVTKTAEVVKDHDGRHPAMKGIYRVLEKAVFVFNNDLSGELDFGGINDVVRGAITDKSLDGIAKIINFLVDSSKVAVCRIESTLAKPSLDGWADVLIYILLEDYQHVCEIQLVHHKMHAQRETQESHDPHQLHSKFKRAKELADKAILRRKTTQATTSHRNLTQSSRQLTEEANRPANERTMSKSLLVNHQQSVRNEERNARLVARLSAQPVVEPLIEEKDEA